MKALIIALLLLGGCGGKNDEPPTKAEVMQTCQEWASAGCELNMKCGVLKGTVDTCVQETLDKCLGDIGGESASCLRTAADAIAECTPRLRAKSCSEYCSTTASGFTFCYAPCVYICAGAQ